MAPALPRLVGVKSGSLRAPPTSLRRDFVAKAAASAAAAAAAATEQYIPDGRHGWRQWASFINISTCVKRRGKSIEKLGQEGFFCLSLIMFILSFSSQFGAIFPKREGKFDNLSKVPKSREIDFLSNYFLNDIF